MTRDPYSDLAAELEAAADLLRRRGQQIEQRFYEWQKLERIDRDATRGGGSGVSGKDQQQERAASRLLHDWRVHLAELAVRVQWVRSQEAVAFPRAGRLEDRHLTAAQVEADGWCGSHWRIGEFVTITTRPSGEPFYRGRCRRCGEWPGGDPPVDVLRIWRDGRSLRVAAS